MEEKMKENKNNYEVFKECMKLEELKTQWKKDIYYRMKEIYSKMEGM